MPLLQNPKSILAGRPIRQFLLAVLVLPGWVLGAEVRSTPLDIARQLNQAFIDVAEMVSTSVVVVEVARPP